MKHLKPLLVVIAVSLAFTGFSQELPRHVFSAGGGYYETAVIEASWTIGQAGPLATTYHPAIILSSGFQQLDDLPVSVTEINEEGEFLVYPNPCSDYVQLNATFELPTGVSYTLYDFSGKALISEKLSGENSYQEVIDLSNLPPGMYNLMIITASGTDKQFKSIKLIRM